MRCKRFHFKYLTEKIFLYTRVQVGEAMLRKRIRFSLVQRSASLAFGPWLFFTMAWTLLTLCFSAYFILIFATSDAQLMPAALEAHLREFPESGPQINTSLWLVELEFMLIEQ